MKKQDFDAGPIMKRLLLSACLLGAVAPNAGAQSFGGQGAQTGEHSSGVGGRNAGVDGRSAGADGRSAGAGGRGAGLDRQGTGLDRQADAQMPDATALPSITNRRRDSRQQPNFPATRAAKADDKEMGPFENYVETVTGSSLKIFGRELFSDVPSTFAPFDGAQVNPDYVIGSGDELQVRGWGMVEIDLSVTVDRSGAIYLPRVGSVKVAGVKYRDLQGYLKKALSKIFSNFELTASISQTRAVQIYVVGHAARPGTYTLNAMSTLLNALFTSGGPDASGSMRTIELKRGTETVTTFDLYAMLVKGDKTRDVTLRDGDVIHIPEVGPLVALAGNVKRPAIFELNGPASLADVVGWAGGFDSAAESKQIIVEKSVANNYQTLVEFVAEKSAIAGRLAGIPVQPTDILRVFAPGAVPVQVQIQNEYVRVAGEVRQSGVFQIAKGETLRALVSRLGGATDNGYVYATQLNRESVKRTQQAKLNEVADRFERDMETAAAQRLAGSTDRENIAMVTSELERQRNLAQKLRSVKADGRIVLELSDGQAQVTHLPDLQLQDGDSVFIPRKPGTVDVLGAVFQQNAFIYRPHRTVGDYVALAGGATVSADKSEMYLIRADGTAESGRSKGWFSGLSGALVNPGDTVVVPEQVLRGTWIQSLKDWTTVLYQFGLGAAGIKALKN
jgi:polysaccharide biosynthesis/export protein